MDLPAPIIKIFRIVEFLEYFCRYEISESKGHKKPKHHFYMNKTILVTATILGIIAIVLGAFGAHGLKQLISPESIQTFETGVKYQMYHALFLLVIGTSNRVQSKFKRVIFYLTLIGIIFFSGSIYGLSTNEISGFDFRTIGFITPIGGFLLISAWTVLLINFLKLKTDNSEN